MIRCWVHQQRVLDNAGRRERGLQTDPPIVVERDGAIRYAHRVRLLGVARIVYDPDGLNNGVRVWVEADDAVEDPPPNMRA